MESVFICKHNFCGYSESDYSYSDEAYKTYSDAKDKLFKDGYQINVLNDFGGYDLIGQDNEIDIYRYAEIIELPIASTL